MGSISLKLRAAKAGKQKIYLHFNYGEKKQLRYATGYGISNINSWDSTKQRVKNVAAEPRSLFINGKISSLVMFAEQLLDDFDRNQLKSTNKIIKNKLDEFTNRTTARQPQKKNLLEFFEWFIDYYAINPLPKTQRPLSKNTVKPYKTALRILKEFSSKKYNVDYQDITLEFYDDYLKFLQEKKFSNNYIGNQFKLIKAIMNYALERNLHTNLDFKKKGFAKITEKVDAIYLTENELKKIAKLKIKGKMRDRARDLFLIGAYTGLRVSDFNRLTADNIKTASGGQRYIEISMQKTGKTVLIPINSAVAAILDKYGGEPPARLAEQKINEELKEIGEKAKIKSEFTIEKTVGGKKEKTTFKKHQLITNHTARRSFCTNAYLAGLSTVDIMAISGHTSEAVFLKYIKVTPKERLERLAAHSFFK